jgi:carbamoyl-phosphate synthase large subunit
MDGMANDSVIGQYDEDIIMMMYDDVVIRRKSELLSSDFPLL